MYNVDIKLVDWEEGNYRVTDSPAPQGEVHVGGDQVAVGYFKREQETNENFYEEHGRRWFKTGDIGTFDNDGVLRIIDRKKDLVKLQHGEYVSYGRTESVLKTAPIVEQICAYADPSRDFIVAIVIPERKTLSEICPEDSLQECCGDKEVQAEVVRQLKEYGTKNGLKAFEIPARVLLGKTCGHVCDLVSIRTSSHTVSFQCWMSGLLTMAWSQQRSKSAGTYQILFQPGVKTGSFAELVSNLLERDRNFPPN